jgi:thioredoxin reductase (NADPH)
MRNVVILGGGPAGLTAAIYAARANLAPLVVEGAEAGGQLMLTTTVENYPGFEDGVLGPSLMQAMRQQAARVGAEFISEDVVGVEFQRRPLAMTTQSGQRLEARAVIVATGASPKMLGLPGEQRLLGRGVSTCATCDGFFFRNRDVIVAGGGDSAMEEALYLGNLAKSVTVIHRRDALRASKIMQKRALEHPKIGFIWNTVIEDILGNGVVSGVRLLNLKTQARTERPVDGVFVAIGHTPNTGIFKDQLELDELGYIRLRERSSTNIPGVFAAGDVHDYTYRQAISAAGYGCVAAIDAERWLQAQAS